MRSQIREKSVKGRVACSTELAGCLFVKQVLSPLLVCCRFIRYQSDLPLTSRGFSVASGMSRKCPPELQSEIDRVLDKQTSTRDSSSHTWGAWMSSEGQALRATIDAPNALIRAVPRVCHREESRPEASSKEGTPATQGRRIMSGSLQHGADPSCSLDPLISLMCPACLLARRPVSERPSAGVSRLQRGLCHKEEVPSVARKPKRSGC